MNDGTQKITPPHAPRPVYCILLQQKILSHWVTSLFDLTEANSQNESSV